MKLLNNGREPACKKHIPLSHSSSVIGSHQNFCVNSSLVMTDFETKVTPLLNREGQ